MFSPNLDHERRFTASGLGHRFAALCEAAGVDASLHRLRHNVATFLVGKGEILQAQARLGHADAATTLREYAYALPLTDRDAADAINDHLDARLAASRATPHAVLATATDRRATLAMVITSSDRDAARDTGTDDVEGSIATRDRCTAHK